MSVLIVQLEKSVTAELQGRQAQRSELIGGVL